MRRLHYIGILPAEAYAGELRRLFTPDGQSFTAFHRGDGSAVLVDLTQASKGLADRGTRRGFVLGRRTGRLERRWLPTGRDRRRSARELWSKRALATGRESTGVFLPAPGLGPMAPNRRSARTPWHGYSPSTGVENRGRGSGLDGPRILANTWAPARKTTERIVPFVKPEVQWYLVEALSNARGHLGIRDDYESKKNQLSHFAGVLAGFRYLKAVTQQEEEDWYHRMLVGLGYTLPDPAPPGFSQAIYVGDPAKRPPIAPPRGAPLFIRSQPGPDQEFEIHGGKLRVIAVEFYDSTVTIRWRVSPQPDIASAFPDEAAALEHDLIGLEEWAAQDLRKKGHETLAMMRLYKFGLQDDLGTSYVELGVGYGGNESDMTGQAEFQAPPPEASVLVFSWLGLEVRIHIR
jgi:hypothetical protein